MPNHPPLTERTLEPLDSEGISAHSSTNQLSERISRALRGLQHGKVTIVVHDGRLVQIDRVVRIRHFRARF